MEMSAVDYESSLAHYGILRKSGRYPWGSGRNPHQRSQSFINIIEDHRKAGLSDQEIAKLYHTDETPFSTRHIRALTSQAVHLRKQDQIRQVLRLREKGVGWSEIGRKMNLNESTVRSLAEPGRLDKLDKLQKTRDMLKRQIDQKGMVDVGAQVQRDLPIGDDVHARIGISKDKFDTALIMLQDEGYAVGTFNGPQAGTGEKTRYRVAFKPSRKNMTQQEIDKEAFLRREEMQLITEKTKDGGNRYQEDLFQKPLNIDSKRVGVRYKEDGGADADGVIYVRPGVPDLSMGKSHYAQVRIAVGGSHYLKGMAIYKDDLPSGVDLLFNTNKSNTGNKLDAMKPLKKDKETGEVDWKNPFGAFPKIGGQLLDEKGKVTSAINKLTEEGDWATWSRNLSSQVLSKQHPDLAKSQLDVTYDRRRKEFADIQALTNPLIKRTLLESFSDDMDSSAVHMKAANLPNQATKVLLPVPSMKPDEVFAPQYKDGERLALVRFPHAGTFEIPQLTVNNKNREALALFRGEGKEIRASDAIGIHPKVAQHLSGADFDGDFVVTIPNHRGTIESTPPLAGLKNFDHQAEYKVPYGPPTEKYPDGLPVITEKQKQSEMGKITNLISDMTVKGANEEEMARAVRHSMVVIDAEKHNLDYKASERDHGILELKTRYQGGPRRGASTLTTRATSRAQPVKRRLARVGEGGPIDPRTGKKVWVDLKDDINPKTGEPRKDAFNSQGKPKTFRSRKLAETDDAHTLIDPKPGTRIENIYADHSNRMKALANEARKEMVATKPKKRDASAAEVYATQVKELKAQLDDALKNAPYERQAQALAAIIVKQRRRANPEMESSEKKKITSQALKEARARTGASKHRIDITDDQWKAIQAGAISIENLKHILRNTDVDKLKERATPIHHPGITPALLARARSMKRSGATEAEIADQLGVSVSTLQRTLSDGG